MRWISMAPSEPVPQRPILPIAARAAADISLALEGPGKSLDVATRAREEERFGRDLSHVRVHSDDASVRSAHALGAAAYSVGSQIVFGSTDHDFASPTRQRLLTHELAHVIQQGGRRSRPRHVAPIGSEHESQAQATAAGRSGELSAAQAGVIQRSPLSDKVRAAAGPAPTLSSVLAALSGNDVQVNDADLDTAISQMLGGRTEDIALAQQVRRQELGTTSGWAGPKGIGDATLKRSIKVHYVPGHTNRRALVIAGVHGSEVQGVEVAERVLADLTTGGQQAEMSAIIVPNLFPDDAAYRDREGPGAPPNRNFPDPSLDLAASNRKDKLSKVIRPENVMLMQLMERFAPERIISIHGTFDPSLAGVSYDSRALDPGEEESARAWGINPDADATTAPRGLIRARGAALQQAAEAEDKSLALRSADLIESRTKQGKGPQRKGLKHPSVAGNFKGQTANANFARWEGGMAEGISLGGYASKRGISIFTVEPPDNKKLSEYKDDGQRAARDVELKAYTEAIRTILLGP
jgi:hypothetical protein